MTPRLLQALISACCLTIGAEASAVCFADFCSDYGASRVHNVSASEGAHDFEVDGIAINKWTEWYVNGQYTSPGENDFSGLTAVDPSYQRHFAQGFTQIEAKIYNHDFSILHETHVWNVSVSTPQPDLVALGVSASDSTVDPGQSVTVSWTARNQGAGGAGPTEQGVMWSTNSSITRSDQLLEREGVGSLQSNESDPEARTISIPNCNPGQTYYLGVYADYDQEEAESNESNNGSGAVPVTCNVPPQPDLVALGVSVSDSTVDPGQSVTVHWTATNRGAGGASASLQALILSEDSSIGQGDAVLALVGLGPIPPGTATAMSHAVVIPDDLRLGDRYWVGVIVDYDDVLDESDEDNNASSAVPLLVGGELDGRIAFHSYTAYDEDPNVPGSYPLDGTIHIRNVPSGVAYTRGEVAIAAAVDHALNPKFSPDGSMLVFMGLPSGHPKDSTWAAGLNIFVYDFLTDVVTNLSVAAGIGDSMAEDPAFHPNGGEVVFKLNRSALYKLNVDSFELSRLTPAGYANEPSGPQHSPDGNWIVLWEGAGHQASIARMASQGGAVETIIDSPERQDYYPFYWTDDWIVYVSWDMPSSDPDNPDDDDVFLSDLQGNNLWADFNSSDSNESDPFPISGELLGYSTDGDNVLGFYDLWWGDPLTGLGSSFAFSHAGRHDLGGAFTPLRVPEPGRELLSLAALVAVLILRRALSKQRLNPWGSSLDAR